MQTFTDQAQNRPRRRRAPAASATSRPVPADLLAVVGPVEIVQLGDINYENLDDVYATDGAAPYDVTAVLLQSLDGSVAAYNTVDASIVANIDADSGYVVARGLVSYGVDSF